MFSGKVQEGLARVGGEMKMVALCGKIKIRKINF